MSDLDQLRDLLVGSVVDAIDPPDKGVAEAIAKFTVRKGARKHEFHLHATDLGWWVGEHGSVATDPEGNDVLESITTHLASEVFDDHESDASTLKPLADAKTRRVGFQCRVTGQQWWISISTSKGMAAIPHIREALATPLVA